MHGPLDGITLISALLSAQMAILVDTGTDRFLKDRFFRIE